MNKKVIVVGSEVIELCEVAEMGGWLKLGAPDLPQRQLRRGLGRRMATTRPRNQLRARYP